MTLYYAVGGGLGHLTRARAVVDRLGLADRATLLTASAFADDPRVTGGLRVLRIPAGLDRDRAAYRHWLRAAIGDSELYVDSFPGGVIGELGGLTGVRSVHHVSRRLRWRAYARRLHGPLPRFDRSLVIEALEPEHAAALRARSERVEPLDLDPTAAVPATDPPAGLADGDPLWLVVHSGPEAEVTDLLRYADEQRAIERSAARIVVVSPAAPAALPPAAAAVDHYPAASLYPLADRIFTACGFNAMRETAPYRDRHRFVPYERALDDQFWRAAEAGATSSRGPATPSPPRRAAPRYASA